MSAEYVATCFISYSHADKGYASEIAYGLTALGYRVWIDQGELRIGDSLVDAISRAIDQVDFLIALVSDASVASNWCQKEVALAMTGEINRRGITVLPCRIGDVTMPPSLADKLYLSAPVAGASGVVTDLERSMRQHLAPVQPLPPRRRQSIEPPSLTRRTSTPATYSPQTPVRMTGIDTNSMTSPRLDGTRGSALYMVPITLDVAPDHTWVQLFLRHWDRPPRFTTMHRPGIASVVGSSIRLNATTVEEIERYHAATLKLAVDAANRDRAALAEHEEAESSRLAEESARRRAAAEDIAGRIRFD